MKTPNEKPPIPPEELAEAIVAVADAAKKLFGSRLNSRAIVTLIHDSMPVKGRPSRSQIQAVLTHATGLESTYLRKR